MSIGVLALEPPNILEIYHSRSYCYKLSGNLKSAWIDSQRILAIDSSNNKVQILFIPTNLKAKYIKAWILYELGQYERSTFLAWELLATIPKDKELFKTVTYLIQKAKSKINHFKYLPKGIPLVYSFTPQMYSLTSYLSLTYQNCFNQYGKWIQDGEQWYLIKGEFQLLWWI